MIPSSSFSWLAEHKSDVPVQLLIQTLCTRQPSEREHHDAVQHLQVQVSLLAAASSTSARTTLANLHRGYTNKLHTNKLQTNLLLLPRCAVLTKHIRAKCICILHCSYAFARFALLAAESTTVPSATPSAAPIAASSAAPVAAPAAVPVSAPSAVPVAAPTGSGTCSCVIGCLEA